MAFRVVASHCKGPFPLSLSTVLDHTSRHTLPHSRSSLLPTSTSRKTDSPHPQQDKMRASVLFILVVLTLVAVVAAGRSSSKSSSSSSSKSRGSSSSSSSKSSSSSSSSCNDAVCIYGRCKKGNCKCDCGWSGEACDTPICPENFCANGGTCTDPGTCSCPVCYTGARCEADDGTCEFK